jgi:pimeloyl-ACP methyl ester carboxylesterase
MPKVLNHGVVINYQVEGQGRPLVLMHGGYGSLEDWYDYGYVAGLKERFRLILLDARAHGRSGKPHEPERYSPQLYASDVVAVMDELAVQQSPFLGFSFGGRIGYWLARYAPQRLCSLIVLAMDPYPSDMLHVKRASATLEAWVPKVPNISDAHKSRLLANDKQAFIASASRPWPDDSDLLSRLDKPCLIVCGERDGSFDAIKRSAEAISGATFVQLDGCDHLDVLVRSDLTLPLITKFLSVAGGSMSLAG